MFLALTFFARRVTRWVGTYRRAVGRWRCGRHRWLVLSELRDESGLSLLSRRTQPADGTERLDPTIVETLHLCYSVLMLISECEPIIQKVHSGED